MEIRVQLRGGEQGTREVVCRLLLQGDVAGAGRPEAASRIEIETPPLVAAGGVVGAASVLATAMVAVPDGSEAGAILEHFDRLGSALVKGKPVAEVEGPELRCSVDLTKLPLDQWTSVLEQFRHALRCRLALRGATTSLRVHRLELRGVRGIRRLDIPFLGEGVTVIAGENGTGKTTILHAVGTFLADLARTGGARGIARLLDAPDDVLVGTDEATAVIHCSFGDEAGLQAWDFALSSSAASFGWHRVLFRRDDAPAHVPVFVLYGTNRAVLEIPQRIRTRHRFEPRDAYDGAFGPSRGRARGASVDFRLFFEWFREREDLENELRLGRPDRRDAQLTAVRRAIEACFEEVRNLRVRRAPQRMQVDKGETELYVDQLSDGEKCLLALVGDLARRLATAHPYLDDPLTGAGVVLVDEVELHMHPRWQRRILRSLTATFPACQFIVTTHSPQVLGEALAESVRLLRVGAEGIEHWRPSASLGLDANVVLEDLLGVPARNAEVKEKLERLGRLIDDADFESARLVLAELASRLGEDHRDIVGARWELAIAEGSDAED